MSSKVLVVDDEALICTMLERTLRLDGYEVKSSTSPEDGLGFLKQEPFDVLITDLHMSGMNGLELLELIRSSSRAPKFAAFLNAMLVAQGLSKRTFEGFLEAVVLPVRQ